jgi:hypothetical protein
MANIASNFETVSKPLFFRTTLSLPLYSRKMAAIARERH